MRVIPSQKVQLVLFCLFLGFAVGAVSGVLVLKNYFYIGCTTPDFVVVLDDEPFVCKPSVNSDSDSNTPEVDTKKQVLKI